MSMQLYIKYESITLDFQTNGYEVLGGFYPETPDDGMERISDQFQVRIEGISGADVKSKINAIRLAFEHAKDHKDDALAAYLYYDVDDSGDAWMTKLTGGKVLYDSRLESTWRHNQVVVTIIVGHNPYWDAQDEVQVPLSNGNGTNNISGLKIYNCNDGAGASPNHHDNYVEVQAKDVLGDLPGATRLEITNVYATGKLFALWIGQDWTNPGSTQLWIEGEESGIPGTDIYDISCSLSYYEQYSLASGAEASMFSFLLSAGDFDKYAGRYFKVLARFLATIPTNVKLRIKLIYKTGVDATTIWQTGQFMLDTSRSYQIRDLFTMRLPPWLIGQTELMNLTFIITGQQSTGSPIDVNLDFIQITPLDGWRMLECIGYGVAQNERMVDDGFTRTKWVDDGVDAKAGIVLGYGNQIELYPGKTQRIYFLMEAAAANTAEIDRTVTIKLFYRPRRQTL
jgi:hypothetical protein